MAEKATETDEKIEEILSMDQDVLEGMAKTNQASDKKMHQRTLAPS